MIPDDMVRRHTLRANAEALFSLSQTQRRLSHRARREAQEAEKEGNRRWYIYWTCESDRLWRLAKWHLNWSREQFNG